MITTRYIMHGQSVLLAALVLSCGFGQAETMDELYAKAKAEKSLTIMPAAR